MIIKREHKETLIVIVLCLVIAPVVTITAVRMIVSLITWLGF